ncbi:hypothetical protein COCC4DRAFT_123915 [Bipolaris maydis ATCC 48331]|uniref:Uncharacterized protein n=2 Tax=Cochliobolus heterostrophus TaxID=5016 RepID=M2UC20_COCH5|nr:uncharacterized protein COCC4DRAFT_123915 [Bipolaris maydis ATCC 48331]EMD96114.1 hypothetical protein COCHEDRAFT_1210348 [Bipolaris maydis C5]ENI10974.1 hypothetical protein COCC4DRAFT_123915 [Bipolaris maydis ATCC 48331]KAH7561974.1 hypothetical protein BM1_03078 [Bipolaris maydis]KAJ5065813.1 hypothetical protein J3E74DRAFT_402009 [Bipolaris maydis]
MSFPTPASPTTDDDAPPHPQPQPQPQPQQQPKQEDSPRFKPLASITEVSSLASTSSRPFTIAELEKTPPFFFTFPTIVKLKNHGTIQVDTASHMNDLLAWYRLHSGEYSDAEIRGLASKLDVGQTTMRREEYDGAWVVDASLREAPGKEGKEEKEEKEEEEGHGMEVKEQVQEEEK